MAILIVGHGFVMVYGGLLVSFFFNRQVVLNAYITIFLKTSLRYEVVREWSGLYALRNLQASQVVNT